MLLDMGNSVPVRWIYLSNGPLKKEPVPMDSELKNIPVGDSHGEEILSLHNHIEMGEAKG
ncbi:hypothetical protein SAMN04489760_11855 [Syntrophus gentianae]|uniref:Uncharacterized protein n=1 Tax=Syntrophus gentianae TaxID=43775 RepID=A0A1H7YXZ9_9BACT|nr:hypothetical protein SAMN04489760_11855 [Syntrophus gentianae]